MATLVHAYNSTRHESTRYVPFSLMFGREPRLPNDKAFRLDINNKKQQLSKYVESLREKLKYSYKLAQGRPKKTFDTKVKGARIDKGDYLLAKIVPFDEKHKI